MGAIGGIAGLQSAVFIIENAVDINIAAIAVFCDSSDAPVYLVNFFIGIGTAEGGLFGSHVEVGFQHNHSVRLTGLDGVHDRPVFPDNTAVIVAQFVDAQHQIYGVVLLLEKDFFQILFFAAFGPYGRFKQVEHTHPGVGKNLGVS